MALDPRLGASLTLPAICAPMYRVTSPALVREACKAGLIGGLPRQNARDIETFEAWLGEIRSDLDRYAQENPGAPVGPIAVNLSRMRDDLFKANADICQRYGVDIIISAMGDPTELIKRVHGFGGKVFHDVTNIRFAEKAIAAGADLPVSVLAVVATPEPSVIWRSSPRSGACSMARLSWPERFLPELLSVRPKSWVPTLPISAPASSPLQKRTPTVTTSRCWSRKARMTSPLPGMSRVVPPIGSRHRCAAWGSTRIGFPRHGPKGAMAICPKGSGRGSISGAPVKESS